MSRAEGAPRLLDAAIALGVEGGVSALTVQGIADAAGVSKALVLYHFGDKRAVFTALARRLADADAAAMQEASAQEDPIEAWRALGSDAGLAKRRALLGALVQELPVRRGATALLATRRAGATALAAAMLESAGLRPRIAPEIIGTIALQQLDGLAVSSVPTNESEATLDAFALALLSLGE